MVSTRSQDVSKDTGKKGKPSKSRRRALSPLHDQPVKINTRGRAASALKANASKINAARQSSRLVNASNKSSSSKKPTRKQSTPSAVQVKTAKSRKKPKAPERSPSPRFVYKTDPQEREYAQYVPKANPVVDRPPVPLPPAENPYACIRDRCLGQDVIDAIIRCSPDRQTLHAWQQVNLDSYALATRLLYSQGVTLSTQRGYISFFSGSRPRHTRADGPDSPRLKDKKTLLPMVTAIKFTGVMCLNTPSILKLEDFPVEIFRDLSRVCFDNDGLAVCFHETKPSEAVRRWLAGLPLVEVRYGGGPITPCYALCGSCRIKSGFLEATQGTLRTVHHTIYKQYPGPYTGPPASVELCDKISFVMSDQPQNFALMRRFCSLFYNIRYSKYTCFTVYGVAQQPPGTAVIEGFKHTGHPADLRESMLKLEAKLGCGDIQGDEVHCQAIVNSFFQAWVTLTNPSMKLEFKLISELPPFFKMGHAYG